MATGDFIEINKTNLGASCINIVRGTNTRQATQCNSIMGVKSNRNWYVGNASMPNDVSGTAEVKWSEFRQASVITGYAKADPESPTTYGTANNGSAEIYLCCQSVVTDATNRKNYSFKVPGDSSWVNCVESVASPTPTLRSRSVDGLSHGTYTVCARDGLSIGTTQISRAVVVGYGGPVNVYNNIQQ